MREIRIEDVEKVAFILRCKEYDMTPCETCKAFELCHSHMQDDTDNYAADLLDALAERIKQLESQRGNCVDSIVLGAHQYAEEVKELEAKLAEVTRQRDECKRKLYLLYCRSCIICGNFDPNRTCELDCNEDNGMHGWVAREVPSENVGGWRGVCAQNAEGEKDNG